jgi:galactose mutarotase-like enzyme
MAVSHQEEQREGGVLDILTDEAAGFRLIVSRHGAELVSLARRDARGEWVGFLYRDNELSAPTQGWANHATVMGYFLHRLKDGKSTYRGRPIEGGTHSFLRTKDWHGHDADVAAGRLTYSITHEDYSPTEYPLNVSLDLSYTLEADGVRVEFRFRNHEPELTAHLGFGLHPGFAATSFESFQLEMPAGLYRRHFSPTNYLSGETEDIQFAGGKMPFAREKLPGSYILELVDVPERTFTFSDEPSGRSVALDLTGVPYVTLWSDGGPFLCVEPCWGLTDHHEQRAFENKEGIQKIAAGGELQADFVMTPRLQS